MLPGKASTRIGSCLFVCLFVCAGKELTREAGGVAKERSLLFLLRKEMSAASFEKSRLKLVGSLQGHSDSVYSCGM